MSTDEYVPSEQDLEVAWIESEASADDINVASAEFDRFLARVRRDAAREALNGLIEHARRLAREGTLGPGTAKVQSGAAIIAEEYRDTHYPERADHG